MTEPIAYARPLPDDVVRRRLTGVDVLLWFFYYVGWIAGGALGGAVLATRFDDRFTGSAEDALYWGCMAAGTACAVAVGFFARRAKPLHHAMIWMGVAGVFPSAYMAYAAYRDQSWLWRIGVVIGLVLAGVAVAVAISGLAGLALRRRRRRT